jgi:Homeodomain-like domain
MPWKECSVMDERLQFVARRLAGEPMADLCREFGISRKTGYKVFDRYQGVLGARADPTGAGVPFDMPINYPFRSRTISSTSSASPPIGVPARPGSASVAGSPGSRSRRYPSARIPMNCGVPAHDSLVLRIDPATHWNRRYPNRAFSLGTSASFLRVLSSKPLVWWR